MICKKCGIGVESGWRFCPRCGSMLAKTNESIDALVRMDRQMKGAGKTFGRDFEIAGFSQMFPKNMKAIKGGGFSIKITQSGDGKPRFEMQTFGDMNNNQATGKAKPGFRERISRAFGAGNNGNKNQAHAQQKHVCLDNAKTTSEPETCIRNIGSRVIAEIKLPGVRDSKHIEVRPLESSVEIKALAGDKAYFKILGKPPRSGITRQSFEKDVLIIEFT